MAFLKSLRCTTNGNTILNNTYYSTVRFNSTTNTDDKPRPKRYQSKRYRNRILANFPFAQYLKAGNFKQPLNLNEHGEYITKYGDWLHRSKETLYVRDRNIWEEEFRKLRKKYRQEYQEKFRLRLAEFTRIADAKMYDLNLRRAQEKERKRLSNIRINALNAANNATKARKRMELKQKYDIINYDIKDQKRDLIREMIWEKPSKNWIIKENFNQKLNLDFIDFNDKYCNETTSFLYPGLPHSGDYDTMQGLIKYSDKYFDYENDNNALTISNKQNVTSITKQPISWYVRKDDSKDEYVNEIYDSQLALNKHLKRETNNNKKRAFKKGIAINYGKNVSIEYEYNNNNIVPNYWFNIDWDKEYENRNLNENNNLDKSSIFINGNIMQFELNKYEDFQLLSNKKYYHLIKYVNSNNINDLINNKDSILNYLYDIYADLIPDVILQKYNQNSSEFLNMILIDILNDISSDNEYDKCVKGIDSKRWNIYKEFHSRMKHFSIINWKSAKINFDSGIRKWRNDVLKWRYLVFKDNEEHIEWRQRLRNKNLSEYDINLCKKAIIRFQQLEHLILARRTGPNILEKLINELEIDVMKVFYIWFEELTEYGEEISMGRGWSFNRYNEKQMLPYKKSKQIPIEYFKLPTNVQNDNNVHEKYFVHKSH